ncbi:hypothetical protein Syun_023378 [Stephania yunnanensis]|uniref:Retrotransposon gag domain-containing protein n=1 Tax=Stephania yunnanensis TaxID=152371 RepID=A0AAP0I279_9MAGN
MTLLTKINERFLDKFFPAVKVNKRKLEINHFKQEDTESLGKGWERFEKMLRRCLRHRYVKWTQHKNTSRCCTRWVYTYQG